MTGSNKFAIDHLGIAVKSIDQALGFYRDALGLAVEHRETVVQEMVNVAMLPEGNPDWSSWKHPALTRLSQNSSLQKGKGFIILLFAYQILRQL